MARAIVMLMDSFGVGEALDAKNYGDQGADTLGNIAEYCAAGKANNVLRQGKLALPNLQRYGLGLLSTASTGRVLPGFDNTILPQAQYGYACEKSFGKDTPSGHWEIAGVPVCFEWGYFGDKTPSFSKEIIDPILKKTSVSGILANHHASGTEIIERLGEEHCKTGLPIVYTSGDSVFQVAAHEEYFGLEKLYDFCLVARKVVDAHNIGRVIARPFVGEPGNFKRTANRRDYATPPPEDTLLDKVVSAGQKVYALGKTADIFAHRGVSHVLKADGNDALFSKTLEVMKTAEEGSLIFTNFVDFDSQYGHRRDVAGYALALEQFDARLLELEAELRDDDVVVFAADHGCDPTRSGSDHTREHIPVILYGKKIEPKFIGRRETFADIGQTIAKYLNISPLDHGVAF